MIIHGLPGFVEGGRKKGGGKGRGREGRRKRVEKEKE